MNLIPMVADLGVGSPQVEIAEVEVHSLVLRNGLGTCQASLDQWIGILKFNAIEQHTERPHETRKMVG